MGLEQKKIDVSPDMQFYTLLDSYPYTVKNALSEYIDNALEAYRTAKKNLIQNLPKILTITISIKKNRIIINDNGTGIAESDIQRAMKPALKPKEQSLSEFGIGMKAASFWFGQKWTLNSYPVDGTQPFSLKFDLNELLKKGLHEIPLNPITNRNYSGVEIILENYKREIDENHAKRIWKELQETYQLFCSRKDPQPILNLILQYNDKTLEKEDFSKITVTNESLIFPVCKYHKKCLYVIGENIEWKKNIEFEFNNKKVYGFISLGKKSSQTENPGLRLFRFGRLIKGTSEAHYRPTNLVGTSNKHAPSRFYAELHLDGQEISNSKGEFIFDEYLFLDKLKNIPEVMKFIEQAENYRSKLVLNNNYKKFETYEKYEEFLKKTNTITKKNNSQYKDKLQYKQDITFSTRQDDTNIQLDFTQETKDSNNKSNINNINSDNLSNSEPNNDSLKEIQIADHIEYSEALYQNLEKLGVSKLPKFYFSLCKISLSKDPLVAYVCAWSILESLKNLLSDNTQQSDLSAFYKNKLSKMIPNKSDKNDKKKYEVPITEIHHKGNLCKHDGEYEIINALQLNNDFRILERLLIFCINDKLNQSK